MESAVGEQRAAFTQFVADNEPSLRRALVASLGTETGREATAEALAYAWEHWSRVSALDNPVGYLYKVGRNKGRRMWRRSLRFAAVDHDRLPWVEPGLPGALAALSERQRTVLVLVHGFGWRHREVAELLGISLSSVQNHLERGLAKTRAALGGLS